MNVCREEKKQHTAKNCLYMPIRCVFHCKCSFKTGWQQYQNYFHDFVVLAFSAMHRTGRYIQTRINITRFSSLHFWMKTLLVKTTHFESLVGSAPRFIRRLFCLLKRQSWCELCVTSAQILNSSNDCATLKNSYKISKFVLHNMVFYCISKSPRKLLCQRWKQDLITKTTDCN